MEKDDPNAAALAAEQATLLFENLLAPPQQAVKRKWEDCDYRTMLPEFSQPRDIRGHVSLHIIKL